MMKNGKSLIAVLVMITLIVDYRAVKKAVGESRQES